MVLQFITPYIGTHGEEGGGGGKLLAIAGAVALVAMIIGIIGMWYEVHQVWFLSKVAMISLCLRYHTFSFA